MSVYIVALRLATLEVLSCEFVPDKVVLEAKERYLATPWLRSGKFRYDHGSPQSASDGVIEVCVHASDVTQAKEAAANLMKRSA